jgi:spore coat polysaccharide biosynthesis protein SpsF (cytidylyltransferase family)
MVKEEFDTEIWGSLIKQPKIFNVKQLKVKKKYKNKNYRMTLDEINDYKFFTKLYKMFPKDSVINILDAYKCLEENPQISNINKLVKQKDLSNDIKKRISNFYENNYHRIMNLKKNIYKC